MSPIKTVPEEEEKQQAEEFTKQISTFLKKVDEASDILLKAGDPNNERSLKVREALKNVAMGYRAILPSSKVTE